VIDVRPWVPAHLRPALGWKRESHEPTIAHYQAGARRLAQLPLNTFLLVRLRGVSAPWDAAFQICSGRGRLVEHWVSRGSVLTVFWIHSSLSLQLPRNISTESRAYNLIIQPGQPGFDEMWAFRAACSAHCSNTTLLNRAIEAATK
jgi:hypothetical protein